MPTKPWTTLKQKGLYQLRSQDRLDPAGNSFTVYQGEVFMMVDGERRLRPDGPFFHDLAKALAWFEEKTGGAGD